MITAPTDPQQYYFDRYDEPRQHIDALLNASVITLDIRPRLLFPLWRAGVRTVGDLLRMYRTGLRKIRNIGVGSAADIERILNIADLTNIDQRQKD